MLLSPGQRVDFFYWVYCQRIRASGVLNSWMLFQTRIPTSNCYRKPKNVDLSQMLTLGMLSAPLHLSGRFMYMGAYVWVRSTRMHCELSVYYSIKSEFIIRVVHLILLGEDWSH
ncbi:hypothetical protein BO85DRAFT_308544 [Aspergillus piperis CBS 112811]|uniref:Uncharacterized protein n=1 Tax=Aspergillus piperis CBS 112811 TaxID=1448313 RepID=A0A8G1R396_9EURO|nr:hypothetical protein BO85DRAFT_308544 [Aspergillus piperis CBS 112811]RAH57717.1 hypothetical protein BO85DRAFT_308544 [Aspergillus piperis CBS 112811]